MKILLSKEKIFLIILFFSTLLVVIFLFSFNYLRNRNQDEGLLKLKEYCNSVEKGKKCILLLQGDYFQDDNRCFSARIPVVKEDNTNEELYFCLSSDLVTWYNPYLDYESFVPVSLIQKKDNVLSFFNRNFNKKIEILVIDDSEVKDLYENIKFAPGENVIGIRTKENFKILSQGYYITGFKDTESGQEGIGLLINETKLASYSFNDNGSMNILLEARINNNLNKIDLELNSFIFLDISIVGEETPTVIDKSNIDTIYQKNLNCSSLFTQIGDEKLEEEKIDEYIEGLINDEGEEKRFKLKFMSCYKNDKE